MSDDPQGLTSEEARRRLAAYGPNEPVHRRRLSAIAQLVRLFGNPLVVILLVASVISASLGQRVDALIIVTIVLLSISINFWQSYQSQHAADRLRASVTPTATVLRDGQWREVPLRAVVPGDVFRLSAGDLVPADGRLIESRDLAVQQSMLTGESLPADKHASIVMLHHTRGQRPGFVGAEHVDASEVLNRRQVLHDHPLARHAKRPLRQGD